MSGGAGLREVYEGVRVLDFTQLEQGPSGTQVLADFGAEVIKIERHDIGEIGRDHSPRVNGMSPHWAANNRNKLSLSLDLKAPGARDVLERLVKTADVVASNFRPGVMERLGLGYDDLRAINPRIICAYASGYGRSGPYAERRGQDLAAQAMGGVLALTGSADSPTAAGTYAIDYVAAMHFAQGIMLALAARERTGEGQVVDSCLLNSAVALHLQEATTYLNTGREYPRPAEGIAHSHSTALYARYRTADDRWLVLVGEYFVDQPWQRVCDALGLTEHRDDPRFATTRGLAEHVEETRALLQHAFDGLSLDQALKALEEQDLLAAPVNDYPHLFEDPQVLHNELVVTAEHPHAGTVKLVGPPVKLSATPARVRNAPPTVGQDNEQVLSGLGFTSTEVARLQETGVVGIENRRHRETGVAHWGPAE
ncbi:CaiB/BaiF CoA transferase family protein [Amycolatopsis sp. NPDC001319]|uniref:CaiB/BaiF CoA transferase family protein n=1 Tax=unclassified Amycolatopsis TaxID=2618356 RepID=UPI0036B30D6E